MLTPRYILATLAPMLGLVACGHAGSTRPTRVAVLPLDSIGLTAHDAERLNRTISRQIAQVADVPLADRAVVQRELTRCKDDRQSIRCTTRVGHQSGASHVVFGAVGRLGRTYVLRLKLLRVSESAVTRAVEETLFDPRAELNRSLATVTQRLFDLPGPSPWYTRWWLWTAVGVAVTAAIVLPLTLTGSDDPYQPIPLP